MHNYGYYGDSFDASRRPSRSPSLRPSHPYAGRTASRAGSSSGSSNGDRDDERDYREEGCGEAGQRRHVCHACGKRFNRPSSLRIHRNTHTGETPFQCPHPGCGRTFNVNSNMRRHFRNHSAPGEEHSSSPSLKDVARREVPGYPSESLNSNILSFPPPVLSLRGPQ
ncbi:hypothetical protein FB451DRAFT_1016154 [Mycena latifolia]|nr:hypothetical protein FB451DRAFT_1016154 [Mycena latifolia]